MQKNIKETQKIFSEEYTSSKLFGLCPKLDKDGVIRKIKWSVEFTSSNA